MLALHPPVEAPIVRAFHYAGSPFARGLHRGVDFGTRAGEGVTAPCGGRVAWAGTAGVTLVCAGRRVTLLPISPSVAEGATVRPGEDLGEAGLERLHLGVRRPDDPFGYEDPERFMTAPPPSVPVVGPRPAPPRHGPNGAQPSAPVEAPRAAPVGAPSAAPVEAPRTAPAGGPGPSAAPVEAPRTAPAGGPAQSAAPAGSLAPWPAWAGLAAALAGAFGSRRVRRGRRRRMARTAAAPVRAGPEAVP